MKSTLGKPLKLNVAALITLTLCVCLGGIILAATWDIVFGTTILGGPSPVDVYFRSVSSRVHVGDDRADAIQALSDAWYHGECDYLDGTVIDDIFIFGPHDRDHAVVIEITSKLQEGGVKVTNMGLLESEMFASRTECLPADFITATPPS
jgi:hypothetical protein